MATTPSENGMFLRTSVFIFIVIGLFSGCRRDNNYHRYAPVRNHELMVLEDQNYLLLDEIERLRAQLDSCHRANTSMRRTVGSDVLPEPMPENNGNQNDNNNEEDPDDLTPPKINLGDESDKPASHFIPKDSDPNGNKTANKSRVNKTSHVKDVEVEMNNPNDSTVAGIKLNPFLTGGHNTDGKRGDEGILVVFQPRNKEKQVLQASGSVKITLRSPTQIASAAPVAVWKFKASEVATHYRKTLRGTALQFDLPWPNQPPRQKRLNLLIEFTSSNGKTFTAKRQISIESKNYRKPAEKNSERTAKVLDRAEPTEAPVVILNEESNEPVEKKQTEEKPVAKNQETKSSESTAPKKPTGRGAWRPDRD